MRYRTRGRLHCPMVLRVPWGGGIRAPEHHSEANEAIFTNVPGLRVVMPSSPARAYGMLLAAIRDPDPVIFFEPKRIYRQYKELVPDDGEALPLDVCYVLRDGTDVTLVTWGAQVKETLEAAEKLAAEGISAEVIDVATLRPLDFATIAESVSRTGRCVIVHEAPKTAGFGAEIAARLAEESMYDLLAPVERVTGYDTHIPLFRLEMKYLPSVDRIVSAAKRTLAAG
jgi:pyruvate dehydrogenase E1 component beta subunit